MKYFDLLTEEQIPKIDICLKIVGVVALIFSGILPHQYGVEKYGLNDSGAAS